MKKNMFSVLAILLLFCLIGCENAPEVSDTGEMVMTARVIWASVDSITVCILPESSFGTEDDEYTVSTKVSSQEGVPAIDYGDTVEITFIGPIQETIPMGIPEGKVCSIKVITRAEIEKIPLEIKPSIMVDGVLYESTGEAREVLRCGTLDGEITSSVDSTSLPTEDNQSNFGEGYGYQFWTDGEIDVVIDDKWIIFKAALCGLPLAEQIEN